MKKLGAFIKKETVLVIAFFCAVISSIIIPPDKGYFGYVDVRVICLLFCLMAVVAGFQSCGLFTVLAQKLLTGKKQLRILILLLVMLPFFTSMVITNDVALLTFVPLGIIVLKMADMERYIIRLVVLQTLAANLGSMATPVGNPQNLFLYSFYDLSAKDFFGVMLPLTGISLVFLVISSLCVRNNIIEVEFSAKEKINAPLKLLLNVALFVLCLLSVFRVLHYGITTAIVIVLFLIFQRKLFKQVDYGLLLTFICFFVFVGNIGRISQISAFLEELMGRGACITSLASSQIISNVPAAVLLSGFTDNWRELLAGVNIGGLGTPIASLASLISLKVYMRYENSNSKRYLLIFTAANIIGIIILLAFYYLK